ncbi:hypothetical protein TNCV_955171 [Trichonephila clavipes]|nr:hypothetical protein TNCV_955171 [Trichonephila clavipes]
MLSGNNFDWKFKGERRPVATYPNDPDRYAIQFKRSQFPVRLAFIMTINKAQGQSLQVCGLNLENHASHAWTALCVACSCRKTF